MKMALHKEEPMPNENPAAEERELLVSLFPDAGPEEIKRASSLLRVIRLAGEKFQPSKETAARIIKAVQAEWAKVYRNSKGEAPTRWPKPLGFNWLSGLTFRKLAPVALSVAVLATVAVALYFPQISDSVAAASGTTLNSLSGSLSSPAAVAGILVFVLVAAAVIVRIISRRD